MAVGCGVRRGRRVPALSPPPLSHAPHRRTPKVCTELRGIISPQPALRLALPSMQCLYLLNGAQHEDQNIEMLIELYNALEQCRFEDVWEFLAQDTDVLKAKVLIESAADESGATTWAHEDVEIKGFVESVRSCKLKGGPLNPFPCIPLHSVLAKGVLFGTGGRGGCVRRQPQVGVPRPASACFSGVCGAVGGVCPACPAPTAAPTAAAEP